MGARDKTPTVGTTGAADAALSPTEVGIASGPPGETTAELGPGTHVGRFVVLERLGAGGMGEVYAAYDPELDRKVALKLLRSEIATTELAQARLRREARTMARIVDRNLVTVHDVGVHAGHVFLAMEFIDGPTLRLWCEGKTWQEILAAYREAARGLAAAHAAGIVHRDFKPDNVLVAADGRVAVTDFGIARMQDAPEEPDDSAPVRVEDVRLTRTGALIGTPRYMAPEQLEGKIADARSDQYSLCVALWEAIYGEHPVVAPTHELDELRKAIVAGRLREPPAKLAGKIPPSVQRALIKGLARDPAQRHTSVAALRDALDLRPSRWLLWGGAAAFLAVAGAAVAYGMTRPHADDDTCQPESRSLIAEFWNDRRKSEIETAFVASKQAFAPTAFHTVSTRLDDWTSRWITQRTFACRATQVYADKPDAALVAKLHCFEGERREVAELVAVYSRAGRAEVERAVAASGQTPRIERCDDTALVVAEDRPPADPAHAKLADGAQRQLAAAKAHHVTGNYAVALVEYAASIVPAALAGDIHVQAEAEVGVGRCMVSQGAIDRAMPHLDRGARLADEARDDLLRAAAMRTRASAAYFTSQYDEARRWIDAAEAAVNRAGGSDEDSGALLQLRGQVEMWSGKPPLGVELIRRAIARFDHAKAAIALPEAYGALAQAEEMAGQTDQAFRDYTKSVEVAERVLGGDHPVVATLVGNTGAFLIKRGKLDDALPMFERALAIKEAVLGPDAPQVAFPVQNIAVILRRKGRFAEAEKRYERALRLFESSPGTAYGVPGALSGLGLVRYNLHHYAEAVPIFRRTIEVRGKGHEVEAKTPEQAEDMFFLAACLWLAGGDKPEARQHATAARDIFKAAGAPGQQRLVEVERWLADPDHFVRAPGDPL